MAANNVLSSAQIPSTTALLARRIEVFHEILLSDDRLFWLRYTEDQIANYNLFVPTHIEDNEINRGRWARFKVIKSSVEIAVPDMDTWRYHLYPELCYANGDGVMVTKLCHNCNYELVRNHIPVPSIAAGWDIGGIDRALLPELSFAESLCISQARIFTAVLNIRLPRRVGTYKSFRGHVISFPQDAPDACGGVMSNFLFAGDHVKITIEGPEGIQRSSGIDLLYRQMGALRVNVNNVLDWLYALKYLHPQYHNVIIQHENIEIGVHNFVNNLIENVEYMVWPSEQAQITREVLIADLTRPEIRQPASNSLTTSDNVLDQMISHDELNPLATILRSRFENQSTTEANMRILSAINQTVQTEVSNVNQGDPDTVTAIISSIPVPVAVTDDLTNLIAQTSEVIMDTVVDTGEQIPEATATAIPSIPLHRQAEPLSDYEQQNSILYGAFPTVFPLGQGCGQPTGPLNVKARKFLLSHFTRRPAKNQLLLLQLHNVKQRADTGRVMAASVRTDQRPLRRFFEIVNAPDYSTRLRVAMNSPNGVESKRLVRELAPYIMMTASRIPFSPLERGTRAASELLAFVRFYGVPNAFLTIGFDERRMAIIARIASRQADNVTESARDFWRCPPDCPTLASEANAWPVGMVVSEDTEIWRTNVGNDISRDPAAIALMCQRLVDAVLELLVGVPMRSRKTSTDFTSRPKGCFGRPRAWFSVTEVLFVCLFVCFSFILYN